MIIPSGRRALAVATAALAAAGGAVVAFHYHRLGLTLSHYDARGHLIVARRIIDSLTPGWQQVGAVWLPLPHLLNLLPVQIDFFYRTGASAVVLSIVAFAVASGAIAWIALTVTESLLAALAAAAVFAFNPNVLYLQATPMTEPLLLALTTSAVALLMSWCEAGPGVPRAVVGWAFALACLTRYEAWPVTAVALAGAVWVRWRQGDALSAAAMRTGAVAVYPAVAIAAFMVFSRVVVGEWFVAGGFFMPENKALHSPVMAAAEIWWGTSTLGGSVPVVIGAMGAAALFGLAVWSRRHATAIIPIALSASAAVPWAAFVEGHPFRIRYMVPLLAMEAIGVGAAIGLLHQAIVRRGTTDADRARPGAPGFTAASAAAAFLVVALLAYQLNPLDRNAAMVVEAQWDRPNVAARRVVTACLGTLRRETKIMASMGSLGHYMQEASGAGFSIRDFLHEGNGDIWLAALAEGPRRFADWVLIEEKAEGGDMLAERVRQQPHFLDGYSRVCEGAGLALYRRESGVGGGAQNLMLTVNR